MQPGNAVRLLALAAIWGSSFVWIEIALRGFSPVQITFARLAIGAAVLVAFVHARGLRLPRGRAVWTELTFAALVSNVLPYTLYGIGQRSVDSTVAGAINATTPLFTLAIALAVGTAERLDRRAVAGLLVGFGGTVLLLAPWQTGAGLAGSLTCLAAAALYGVAFVFMSRRLLARGIPSLVLAAGQLLAATALTALAMPMLGTDSVEWSAQGLVALAALGLGGTGIAYVLNYRLVADEGPTAASTVTYLMPVVSVALGAAALGEDVGVRLVAGIAVVLLGVGLVQRKRGPAVGAPGCPPPSR
ncbi:MAG: DMT family transporter [Sporichthyaceae bacterium]